MAGESTRTPKVKSHCVLFSEVQDVYTIHTMVYQRAQETKNQTHSQVKLWDQSVSNSVNRNSKVFKNSVVT